MPSTHAILYLLAQPLLDLASDHLTRDRELTERYEKPFEVEDSDEWTAVMAEYNREADAITAATVLARGRGREEGRPRGRVELFGLRSLSHLVFGSGAPETAPIPQDAWGRRR